MVNPIRLAQHKGTAEDYARARMLRKNPTDAEQILWHDLRVATREKKYRFCRQHPIHPYTADFVCLKLHLVVEVDGVSHDTRRDAHLRQMGFEVIRFTNYDVVHHRDNVVMAILDLCDQRMNDVYVPLP